MREASDFATDAKVADVKSLFETHVNEGKVVLVVEGPDDKDVYEKLTDVATVCIYVDGNCDKHTVILSSLNGTYRSRLLAIKDADFDRVDGIEPPFVNLLLTDTHDLEGMILKDGIPVLKSDDQERCADIDLKEVYSELEDVSFLKWFNHVQHLGINFKDTTLNVDLEKYFNDALSKTNNIVSVTIEEVELFIKEHFGTPQVEICNGHDIFERIYVRAHAVKATNFAKKPFFRRLREAYGRVSFERTELYKSIASWAEANGHSILEVA